MKKKPSPSITTLFSTVVTVAATAMAATPLTSQKPPIPEECDENNWPAYVCSIEPDRTTYWPYTGGDPSLSH